MLVLSRKRRERVHLATASGPVVVHVCEVTGGKVRLGIEAPDVVRVSREETAMDGVWAIVEVFGRQSFAGLTEEVDFLGTKFLEVRIPEHVRHGTRFPATTKRFPAAAIYAYSPCSEEYARGHLETWSASEVHAFALSTDLFSDLPAITDQEPPPALPAVPNAGPQTAPPAEEGETFGGDLADVMADLSVPCFSTGGVVEARKEIRHGS